MVIWFVVKLVFRKTVGVTELVHDNANKITKMVPEVRRLQVAKIDRTAGAAMRDPESAERPAFTALFTANFDVWPFLKNFALLLIVKKGVETHDFCQIIVDERRTHQQIGSPVAIAGGNVDRPNWIG